MGGGPMITDGNDGAPSFQEAKEATAELAIALGKAYLSSSDPVVHGGSVVTDHDSSLSMSGLQVILDNKACGAVNEIAVAPAVPANIIKAFRLLCENPAAQEVVVSIVSDPKVWNAVRNNAELREFVQSQKAACLASTDTNQSSFEGIGLASNYAEIQAASGIKDIVDTVKINVVHMMSKFSNYFRSFFGVEGTKRERVVASSAESESSDGDLEASFMGLAVMAIAVILTKRA